MPSKSALFNAENNWETKMGAAFPGGKVVLRGNDLFELTKDLSWMQLLLFGITGRKFTRTQSKLFEGIWKISTSYPEPRVWNNRIAELAGTTRSTGSLGISAAIAASEAVIYGQGPMVWIMDFLLRADKMLQRGEELPIIIKNEINTYSRIYGFGRPVMEGDERIPPLMELARNLNFADGKFVKLVFEIAKILKNGPKKLEMNVAALDAALCADQGLNVREFYYFMIYSFTAGMPVCHIDSTNNTEGAFFPLRCGRIKYTGSDNRRW